MTQVPVQLQPSSSLPPSLPHLDVLRLPFIQVNRADEGDVHAQVAVDATALNADKGAHRGRGPAGPCV